MNTDDFIYLVVVDIGGGTDEDGVAAIAAYGEAFRAAVQSAGLPTSFSIFEHHTIGANPKTGEFNAANVRKGSPTGKMSDGEGIDHFFEGGYFFTYLGLLDGVMTG